MKKFRDKRTECLFSAERVKGVPPDVMQRAHNRLRIIANMSDLRDVAIFSGMRLEQLRGDRRGQYSVRVNDQWRICFVWTGQQAVEIEFVDYH